MIKVRKATREDISTIIQFQQKMALENVSFYAPTDSSMSEKEFLLAVLDEADCDLMLGLSRRVKYNEGFLY